MNLEHLLKLQKALDDRIVEEHQLQNSDLFKRKLLALQVEVGELANETRCFKYWSNKTPAPKETILEEYVDGIHFILSLGLELGITEVSAPHHLQFEGSAVDAFQEVYHAIDVLGANQTLNSFKALLEKYLQLGIAIDLSIEDIQMAYLKKNEVNHERQDKGY